MNPNGKITYAILFKDAAGGSTMVNLDFEQDITASRLSGSILDNETQLYEVIHKNKSRDLNKI